jgi:hypothetical protein
VVLKDFELHRKIMDEAHCSKYFIHPRMNKMYQVLKKIFWWTRMKREIMKYVTKLCIPEWKWENIRMDFIVGLPRTSRGYNSIWVIVDPLTMSTHFILVSTTYRVRQYTDLYRSHIIRYHGIQRPLSLTKGLSLLHASGKNCMSVLAPTSSVVQPTIISDKVNQIIQDILCAFVLTNGLKWDKHLPLVEFSYNSSYQESIKISPFEALYGRPCCTPLSWSK